MPDVSFLMPTLECMFIIKDYVGYLIVQDSC